MKQNSIVVKLLDFTNQNDSPFGHSEGKAVFRRLSDYLAKLRGVKVVGISFDGINANDASFARESVVALAKQFRGEWGFYLTQLTDRDLIDNWSYAAKAKDQPLAIWNGEKFEIIGPDLNESSRTLIELVLHKRAAFASEVAADLGMSIQNASTRLKNLTSQGYFLRKEEVAESGGKEFQYQAIH